MNKSFVLTFVFLSLVTSFASAQTPSPESSPEPDWEPAWEPTKRQANPAKYAVASPTPLLHPWKCSEERCSISEDEPNVLVPKGTIVINGRMYCGKDQTSSSSSINDYQCIKGKFVCANPFGCGSKFHHVMPGKLGVEGEQNYYCKKGQCACGSNTCGKNEQCIDGNCWYNGEIHNGYGDFRFEMFPNYATEWITYDDDDDDVEDDGKEKSCDGHFWENDNVDMDEDFLGICCERKGGCWTGAGIHYPQFGCLGKDDKYAHNDSGKPSNFGSPALKVADADKYVFCDQEACTCGESTCRRGEQCVDGACKHIQCLGDKKAVHKYDIEELDLGDLGILNVNQSQFLNYHRCYNEGDSDRCHGYECKGGLDAPKATKDGNVKFYDPSKLTEPETDQAVDYNSFNVETPRMKAYPELVKHYASFAINANKASANPDKAKQDEEKRAIIEAEKEKCEQYEAIYTNHGCYCNGVKRADDDTQKCPKNDPKVDRAWAIQNYNVEDNNEFKSKKPFKSTREASFYYRFHDYYRGLFHFYACNVTLQPNEVCDVTQGCLCGESKCPMSSVCTESGCVDPITNTRVVEEKGYLKVGIYKQCANEKGCKCGEDRCKQGEICLNGFCSPEFEAKVVDGKRYISENIWCSKFDWGELDPNQYVCYKDARITADNWECDSYSTSYVLYYGTPRCALAGGCTCGKKKCPQFAQCVEGDCYYDQSYERVMCGMNEEDALDGSYSSGRDDAPERTPAEYVVINGNCIKKRINNLPAKFSPVAHVNPYWYGQSDHEKISEFPLR